MKNTFFSKSPISLDLGLLILRVIAGVAMISHGWGKFQNVIQWNLKFGDPIGIGEAPSLMLAAFAEFICSILIIMGLATRWAAIPLIITMTVAFFIVHGADEFGIKEKAFLYLGIFFTIFLTGPGKYSVDRLIDK